MKRLINPVSSTACIVMLSMFILGGPGSAFGQTLSKRVYPAASETVFTRAQAKEEIALKLAKVQKFLKEEDLAGVLLSRINNFSWMTAGLADNHIIITSETGSASLLVMNDGKIYLVASSTEIEHLMNEDLKGLEVTPKPFEWHQLTGRDDPRVKIISQITATGKVGSDIPLGDMRVIDHDFARLRYVLSESEIDKMRWVCRQSSEAVATICRTIKPGMTEKDIEAITSDELMRRGLRPTVVLIGTDERLLNYFHYPPQDKKLEKYAFVNVCARRWGLVASVGRYVYFGKIPDSLVRAMKASAMICAQMEAATTPGLQAKVLFSRTKGWFAEYGYAGYWQKTHAGGAIGYVEREWLASDESAEIIHNEQAFAWNPFTKGALSFDTVLLHAGNIENLTALKDWPSLKVKIGDRVYVVPQILGR